MNNTEASLAKIWKTVESVWNDTSSAEVARAFVLAFRVMRHIIAEEGNNSWLANGTPHCSEASHKSRNVFLIFFSRLAMQAVEPRLPWASPFFFRFFEKCFISTICNDRSSL